MSAEEVKCAWLLSETIGHIVNIIRPVHETAGLAKQQGPDVFVSETGD